MAPTLDGVAINRSMRFAAYLESLPKEERRVIENAERSYLANRDAPNSRHKRAAQDFEESMQGLKDTDPAHDRGYKQALEVSNLRYT